MSKTLPSKGKPFPFLSGLILMSEILQGLAESKWLPNCQNSGAEPDCRSFQQQNR